MPVSYTAISDSEFWVLGSVGCGSRRCSSLLHTTDGGAHFSAVAAPDVLTGTEPADETANVRFVDHLNGFAFRSGRDDSVLFATHDGAHSWKRVPTSGLFAFANGNGIVYRLTERCGADGCTDYRLASSPPSSDTWTDVPLPFDAGDQVISLAARDSDVWVMANTTGADGQFAGRLARSDDRGRTFQVGPAPCRSGLGGALTAASSTQLWAVCATGMLAILARSTDGARSFQTFDTGNLELVNSARLAAPSGQTAVVAPGPDAVLMRTDDGGGSWRSLPTPPDAADWLWFGFTDASVGAGIAVRASVAANTLYRTVDGGRHWTPVSFTG